MRAVARARPARSEGSGKLLVGSEEIRSGAAVSVRSETSGYVAAGVLVSMTPTEAMVRMGDDAKVRLPLQHLRQNRCSIHKLPDAVEEAAEEAAAAEQMKAVAAAAAAAGGGGGTSARLRGRG